MKIDLIIVGWGDAGKEIFAWANPYFSQMGFHFKGFLDDKHPDAIAKIADYQPSPNEGLICSIGNPAVRAKVTSILEEKGAHFVNLIHPSAIVLSPLTAYGLVIAPFVYVSNNVELGNHVFLNVSASVGHDAKIGLGSNICAHCDVTGHVTIGEQVFVGTHACILPGKKIGASAIIGAGSAVMRDVPPSVTVIGVPAKPLNKL